MSFESHAMEKIGRSPRGRWAYCSCGWVSAPAGDAGSASRAHRGHQRDQGELRERHRRSVAS